MGLHRALLAVLDSPVSARQGLKLRVSGHQALSLKLSRVKREDPRHKNESRGETFSSSRPCWGLAATAPGSSHSPSYAQ